MAGGTAAPSTRPGPSSAKALSDETPKTLINPYLEKQAAMRDVAALTAMLQHIYRLHQEQKKLMRRARQGGA